MKAIFSFIFFLLTCFSSIAQTEKNALFIGNSYTYVNDLPGIIQEIALSKGNIFSHQSHTPGGSTLAQHASNSTVQNLLYSEVWDYVILQDQSQNPSFPPSQVANEVYPYAASLCEDIRQADACSQPVFFMTWGRENGDAQNCVFYPPLCTYEGMQDRLTESYTEMAEDNNSLLAPVGIAWKNIRANYPSIDLYSSDGSHPSIHGSYLAACVFYSVLFNDSPINAFIPNNISSADAAIIQETTYNSTQENEINFTLVPEAYVNCDGDCLNDTDGDGVCDENEIAGCTDAIACNYDSLATEDDLLCEFATEYYNCDTGCLSDTDEDGVCDENEISGCTDDTAFNFNVSATEDDISCEAVVLGCTDATAFNYNELANTEDNFCIDGVIGCTNPNYSEFDPANNVSDNSLCLSCFFDFDVDGVCDQVEIFGCTYTWANNYNPNATNDDGSCLEIFGCTYPEMFNYDVEATHDDGSCYGLIFGCIDETAYNFVAFTSDTDVDVNTDDGSCEYEQTGGVDCILPPPFYGNTGANMTLMLTSALISSLDVIDPAAYVVALTPEGLVVGSVDVYGLNQTSIAIWGDDTVTIEVVDGALANENISFQLVDGNSLFDIEMPIPVSYSTNGLAVQPSSGNVTFLCISDYIYGCIDQNAINFDENATSQLFYQNPNSLNNFSSCNYNSCQNVQENGCIYSGAFEIFNDDNYNCTNYPQNNGILCVTAGCTDDSACNYDSSATNDDNSCVYPYSYNDCDGNCLFDFNDNGVCDELEFYGCTYEWAYNFNPIATADDGSCFPIIYGCVDFLACNYILPSGNVFVDINTPDGSCIYAAANIDCDGSCLHDTDEDGVCDEDEADAACGDVDACNYTLADDDITTDTDNTLCEYAAYNYDCNDVCLMDTDLDGICDENEIAGCMDESAENYNSDATDDDGSCYIEGCTYSFMFNYDSLATIDNGSCYPIIYGCTDSLACNYIWPSGDEFIDINTDDGSCEYVDGICEICYDGIIIDNDIDNDGVCNEDEVLGCMEDWADNYDVYATDDDDSCYRIGCFDTSFCNYDPIATIDSLCYGYFGCTDQYYIEYDSLAGCHSQDYCQTDLLMSFGNLLMVNSNLVDTISELENLLIECSNESIIIDLNLGWNMIGYTLPIEQDVVATLQEIEDVILIVKNNAAEVYWPEYGFNGIGNLIPGQGYQIKVSDEYSGFTYPNVNGERIDLTPTVPQWAIDMVVEMHPNDIRTLVRVVNMLGQEINPENQSSGTVLLYLYNDASVEKKIK